MYDLMQDLSTDKLELQLKRSIYEQKPLVPRLKGD